MIKAAGIDLNRLSFPVMPVKTGIQVPLQFTFKKPLGFRLPPE
jgi:hypothetical protein